MIEEPISPEQAVLIVRQIEQKKWWQGSVIPVAELLRHISVPCKSDFWVIASQTCNLYNPSFEKVTTIELIAGNQIDHCLSAYSKGDHPRTLHVEALSENNEKLILELDIQKRIWISRQLLAEIQNSKFNIKDANRAVDPEGKNQWLDNFIGWLARSYTRITLPNDFNKGMKSSKIEDVLQNKITKHHNKLYGIYLSISRDSEEDWSGLIGDMPSPYLLEITLISYMDTNSDDLKAELIKKLFEDQILDPEKNDRKASISRVELAQRYGIRIIKAGIDAKTIAEISLLDAQNMIRYSFVDHLSDSSMSVSK